MGNEESVQLSFNDRCFHYEQQLFLLSSWRHIEHAEVMCWSGLNSVTVFLSKVGSRIGLLAQSCTLRGIPNLIPCFTRLSSQYLFLAVVSNLHARMKLDPRSVILNIIHHILFQILSHSETVGGSANNFLWVTIWLTSRGTTIFLGPLPSLSQSFHKATQKIMEITASPTFIFDGHPGR